jgi:hypothetical protein
LALKTNGLDIKNRNHDQQSEHINHDLSKSYSITAIGSHFSKKFVLEDISKYYNIGKEIGYGKYGVVRLVSRKSYERKRFALKSIPRERISADIK